MLGTSPSTIKDIEGFSTVFPTSYRLKNGAWLIPHKARGISPRLRRLRGVAQFGRALGSGPRGRQFKSVRPDLDL